jgi:DNA-directed RNA polymerase specialized sigma24 family protein
MRITDKELKAFPPGEELIKMVEDAVGMGDRSRQREAQEILASLFLKPFQKLIGSRYYAYRHIGSTSGMDDDLQRLYMYIIFGYREDSKSRLKQTKLPLRTWLENLKDPANARSLNHYVIVAANRHLKYDLPRNIERGRGKESLVTWTDQAVEEGAETEAQDRMERRMQLRAHEIAEREKMDDADALALRRHIRECLELMPPEEAELLYAIYFPSGDEKLTQSQYAETKGISGGTVSKRLRRARETLAGLLLSICPDLLQRLGWSKRGPSNAP